MQALSLSQSGDSRDPIEFNELTTLSLSTVVSSSSDTDKNEFNYTSSSEDIPEVSIENSG